MKSLFSFGEMVEGYSVPVINEREARAAAGILFLFGMISFLNAYLTHDFRLTQIFVTVFMMDFIVRVLINPKYAPSLILGRFFVSNQKPEYVGAPQKRFAWSIGLMLSISMFIIIVILEYMTPIKIAVCVACLTLLFFESAFGICIGCKIYQWVAQEKAQYCPGEVCETTVKEPIQRISKIQWSILLMVLIGVTGVTAKQFQSNTPPPFKPNHQMEMPKMKCHGGM